MLLLHEFKYNYNRYNHYAYNVNIHRIVKYADNFGNGLRA